MSTNLHVIHGSEPNEAVVRLLSTMLERAKAGDIRGAVVIFETHENTGHGFAWDRCVIPTSLIGEMNLASFGIHVATGRVHPPR